MILLFEHPTSSWVRERPINSSDGVTRPGAPASCSRCERLPDTACWCEASRRVVLPTCALPPPWPRLSACGDRDVNTHCETRDHNGLPPVKPPPATCA